MAENNLITKRQEKIIKQLGGDVSTLKTNLESERWDVIDKLAVNGGGSLDTSNNAMLDTTGLTSGAVSQILKSISQLDISAYTSTNSMFKNYSALITLPELNTSNVTDMTEMFSGCSSLKVFPNLNTSNVTIMTKMFYGCVSLETAPNLDMGKVTKTGNMFNGCTNLKNVPQYNIGSFNGTGMFSNCSNLTNESLNNILAMCANSGTGNTTLKSLSYIGLTSAQATICQSLSNYQAFLDAGWTTGY